MAALFHAHGIDKLPLARKAFGVFDQRVIAPASPEMQGLGARFALPVSRHALIAPEALAGTGAAVLAASRTTGLSVASDEARGVTMILDHAEYDADTLTREFVRDRAAALPTAAPVGVPHDPRSEPPWRKAGHLLVRNWLAGVSRAKAARSPPDLLGWLLAGAPAGGGPLLVLRIVPGTDPLAAAAEAASRASVTIGAVARQEGGSAIALTLAPSTTPQQAERFASLALALPGVRETLLRGPGDAASFLRRAA
jgi:hypothetical protein